MKKLKLKNKGKDVYIYKGKDLLAKVKGAKGDLSKKGKYLVWISNETLTTPTTNSPHFAYCCI